MEVDNNPYPDTKLKFTSREDLREEVLSTLRSKYGSYIYISDIFEVSDDILEIRNDPDVDSDEDQSTSDGDHSKLVIRLGASIPHDLSDSRKQDNVFKLTKIPDASTLTATKGGGYYSIDLPKRSSINKDIENKKKEMIKQLDIQMAREIYDRLVELPMVKQQLSPIIDIIRWTRRESPAKKSQILDSHKDSDNIHDYLLLLEYMEYISVDEGEVYPARELEKFDFEDIRNRTSESMEEILGDIVKKGIDQLSDLDLTMFEHYPKYSNAYYYPAFERNDPDLYLDLDSLEKTLEKNWENYNLTRYQLNDKIEELSQVGVLNDENGYVTSNEEIFNQVYPNTPFA